MINIVNHLVGTAGRTSIMDEPTAVVCDQLPICVKVDIKVRRGLTCVHSRCWEHGSQPGEVLPMAEQPLYTTISSTPAILSRAQLDHQITRTTIMTDYERQIGPIDVWIDAAWRSFGGVVYPWCFQIVHGHTLHAADSVRPTHARIVNDPHQEDCNE